MNIIFIVLAAILTWLSYKSFIGGLEYLKYFKKELARPRSTFTPFATIFTPCRGVDRQLEANLKAVLGQDYPEFETIFIVDDADDPAVHVINELGAENMKLIVAPKASDSGQKVENLRTAVRHASPSSEVYVFVDSDVCPSHTWLLSLVSPLADPGVGAATGYRWFIASHASLASELRSVWNASIASALGPRTGSNFCWGGSMAMLRKTFEEHEVRERWKGSLSDDFVVTNVLKEAGLPIVFVPGALLGSEGDCTFPEMLEFTTRQMKITRVYAAHLWAASLLGSGLFTGVILAAPLVLFMSNTLYLRISAATTLLLVSLFSIGKSWLRLLAVQLALKDRRDILKQQRLAQLTLWLLAPVVFFYNSVIALFSRRIIWRGITYELKSPSETVIIPD
jgi:ceramide glucosyltransferase